MEDNFHKRTSNWRQNSDVNVDRREMRRTKERFSLKKEKPSIKFVVLPFSTLCPNRDRMKKVKFHRFHSFLSIRSKDFRKISVEHIVDAKRRAENEKERNDFFIKNGFRFASVRTFFVSISIIKLIISMISCSSEPKSSSRSPPVINEDKQRYCFVDKWTFPIDSTAVVDGGEDDDDVIADSNVVGECVRTRLQFRFNNVVIVSFEGEKDIMVGGRSTMLLENWRKREKKTNGDNRQRIS